MTIAAGTKATISKILYTTKVSWVDAQGDYCARRFDSLTARADAIAFCEARHFPYVIQGA